MNAIKLKKAEIRELLNLTFPNYKGRKFSAECAETYYVDNMWGGGSRSYAKAITINRNGLAEVRDAKQACNQRIEIPDNTIIVENCIFCGKDMGIRFYYSPNSIFKPRMIEKK